jgi:hypothetical protein
VVLIGRPDVMDDDAYAASTPASSWAMNGRD